MDTRKTTPGLRSLEKHAVKDNADIAKGANGGSLKGANEAITRSTSGGNHRPV